MFPPNPLAAAFSFQEASPIMPPKRKAAAVPKPKAAKKPASQKEKAAEETEVAEVDSSGDDSVPATSAKAAKPVAKAKPRAAVRSFSFFMSLHSRTVKIELQAGSDHPVKWYLAAAL